MNRIYCIIGKFSEVTQHIELRLGEICEKSEIIKEFGRHKEMSQENFNRIVDDASFLKEKMETMTFGQMIGIVYDSRSLSSDEINKLKTLLGKRNYFTHEYFKYTNFTNATEDFILEEFEAIKADLSELKQMLKRLDLIKETQTNRINYLVNKNKLSIKK